MVVVVAMAVAMAVAVAKVVLVVVVVCARVVMVCRGGWWVGGPGAILLAR